MWWKLESLSLNRFDKEKKIKTILDNRLEANGSDIKYGTEKIFIYI